MKKTETIGDRIRLVRGKFSRDEFANILKVHKNTIVRYEKGERSPDADFILRLISEFSTNPNWILTGEEPMTRREQIEPTTRLEPTPITAADTVDYDEDDEDELTLDEFWQAFFNIVADPAWRGWYRIELIKRFPELTERIKKQREVDRKDELARTKVVGE